MRSSSGKYFIALDHIRALAAFLVFSWHFTHSDHGYPVVISYTPDLFFLALFDEGHTGVALFMTLSGYLFAKLLDGKNINYPAFIWNRALRLLPLLLFILLLVGVKDFLKGEDMLAYVTKIASGLLLPVLPNGGWSITAEFHFYLLLPILLILSRKRPAVVLAVMATIIAIRYALYLKLGEIQTLAYWTIIGRVDQFLLGIVAYQQRHWFSGKHLLFIVTAVLFTLFYWYFDGAGGYSSYGDTTQSSLHWLGGSFTGGASTSLLWLILPTIEGACYGIAIAWYDNSVIHKDGTISRFIALIGTYSYSIYLLHFFIVFRAADFIHQHIIDLSNFYVAMLFSLLVFISMVPLGYLSYRFIESPFLRLRTRYIRD